jgi:hypothetical protein
MNEQLTVIIPTSPIPSHPSTAILDETIANIRKYTDARVIIMFDGVHDSLKDREQDYNDYKNSVISNKYAGKYGECSISFYGGHAHQSGMTRKVLKEITTPLILFCEHDTSPIGDIPFQNICDLVEKSPGINYVRFNIFHEIPKEHNYLMIHEPETVNGVRLQRTIQWSQRPHIAKTDWYRDILEKYFAPQHKKMIEDVMHGVVQTYYASEGYDKFGLTIYTPEGNQLRSYHSDGRGTDTKIIEA